MSLFSDTQGHSMCYSEVCEGYQIIRRWQLIKNQEMLEIRIEKCMSELGIYKEDIYINQSPQSIKLINRLSGLNLSPKLKYMQSWNSITGLAAAIIDKKIRFECEDLAAMFVHDILQASKSRRLFSTVGSLALICDFERVGGWSDINKLPLLPSST